MEKYLEQELEGQEDNRKLPLFSEMRHPPGFLMHDMAEFFSPSFVRNGGAGEYCSLS